MEAEDSSTGHVETWKNFAMSITFTLLASDGDEDEAC